MIRLVVIDDDFLVVQALETILTANAQMTVVGTGDDGACAMPLYGQHQPDVMLMDIRMKDQTGLEAAEAILSHYPTAKILFLTTFQEEEYISKALALGCRGYILKQNITGIVPAIEAVVNGQLVFDSHIVSAIQATEKVHQFEHLTERENELLQLVAKGMNNKEIAQAMFLSEGTVRNYLSLLLEKLALRDRTQLAVYYYTHV